MFFAMVAFFPHCQFNDIFFFESQTFSWLHKQKLWHSTCGIALTVFVSLIVSWGNFYESNWMSSIFFLSIFRCLGIARNFSTMFPACFFNECVFFFDKPASSCVNFLLQFSFSKVSDTSGLFSSKVKPCYNLSKCHSHFAIVVFVFLCICANWEINCVNRCQKLLFIKLLLYLIMLSNCSTFCIGNFCVVRVTVRTQDRTQDLVQLLTKHID